MRTDDIQRVYDPDSHRTERLYVPTKVGVENMTLAQLLPGLCARADMQGKQCRACGGCRFGQRLVEVRGKDLIHPCGVPSPAGEGYNPSGPFGATSPERASCRREATEGFHSLDTKLTKNQLAHAERMKQERRERVARVEQMVARGMPETTAAYAAGYSSLSAYQKARWKCWAEARKERDRHV